jgi:hypothetical protein
MYVPANESEAGSRWTPLIVAPNISRKLSKVR